MCQAITQAHCKRDSRTGSSVMVEHSSLLAGKYLVEYYRGDCSMKQATTGSPKGLALLLERVFGLAKAGTDPRTEFVAGLTTFLTMVYIVFVNPQILGNTGMDKGAVFVATCIAAAVS